MIGASVIPVRLAGVGFDGGLGSCKGGCVGVFG